MTSNSFSGLRVAAFESRRRDELARLIEKYGGEAHVSQSMREAPLDDKPAITDFANRVLTGGVDVIVFLTGVGFRLMLATVERSVDRQRFLNSVGDIVTIARGPKAVAALAAEGITATHRVDEPNTWREILQLVDRAIPVVGKNVVIQEYGASNPSLIAGLEARGGRVARLPLYRWQLPDDQEPLQRNVLAIANAQRDVAIFTSAQQLLHALQVAEQLGCTAKFRDGLKRCIICSIGPATSEALATAGLPVDFEPRHPKMGTLLREAASEIRRLQARKQCASATPREVRDAPSDSIPEWYHSPFMKACRMEPTDRTPIWLMRQAGRYMPEYREIRAKLDFLDMCKRPEICTEIMLRTVEILDVDAAIIFSDLLPLLEPMGMQLEYVAGDGPVIHNPIRGSSDLVRFRPLESVDALDFVFETVRQTRAGLPDHLPVIGFAGAPFTLASYAIEGGASRNFLHTKAMMRQDEGAWRELMTRLSSTIIKYLNAQIAAGAQSVQLFDSWVGCLGVDDYRRYVLPHVCDVITGLTPGVPVILFGTGNPALLESFASARPHVVGVDWRIRLDAAWRTIHYSSAVQGNLDPTLLLADEATVRDAAREILSQAAGRPGHIFNLGHGILPQTPVENVIALVDEVKQASR